MEILLTKRGWPFQAGFDGHHMVQRKKHPSRGIMVSPGYVSQAVLGVHGHREYIWDQPFFPFWPPYEAFNLNWPSLFYQ